MTLGVGVLIILVVVIICGTILAYSFMSNIAHDVNSYSLARLERKVEKLIDEIKQLKEEQHVGNRPEL